MLAKEQVELSEKEIFIHITQNLNNTKSNSTKN